MWQTKTHVAHVERDLQVVDKAVVEFWKKVENVEDFVTCDFVQVAISQRSNIAVWLAEGGMNAGIFAEDVVFTWKWK